MKKATKLLRALTLCLLSLSLQAGIKARAQIVISTNHTATNGNAMISFNVQNTTANPVILTGISSHLNTAATNNVELLYRTTPINQPGTWTDGTVGPGQNGWISAGTATLTNTADANGVVPVLSGLSVTIPAGSTYGFILGATSIRYMDLGSGINTFSASGINLLTGNGMSWGGAALPATPSNYPRGFVGSIELVPGVPCNGQPNQGTTSGPAQLCPSELGYFSVTGASLAGSIFYQWQSSANGIVWNDIVGENSFGYSATISSAVNLRRMDVCTVTNDTVYSIPHFVDVNPFYNCYCTSNATYTTNGDIGLVEIGGLSNNSSATMGNCEQYTDFTTLPATPLFQGVPTNVKVTVTDCEGTNFPSNAVVVFIDYNQDGDFNGPGERVFTTPLVTGALTLDHTGSFTVPPSALTGVTRMRVINTSSNSGTVQSPCGTYSYGETEDYLVDIQPQPAAEVALVSIDAPVPASCSFGSTILVSIKNNGSDTLTSALFDVNSGGILIPNISWTGSVLPGETQQIQIPGTYAFNDGDSLHVTIKDPNGSPDFTFDNELGFRHYLSLFGEYTVGYGTTNLANREFADIVVAVQTVYQRGICDTVYFNIKDDTYTTRFLLQGDYFNYSPGDMVIFRSETKNANALIIKENASGTSTNYLVRLENTHGWGFEHITFQPEGTNYRSAIDILGSSGDIIIDSCRFIGNTSVTGTTSASANAAAIKTASSSVQNDIRVTYNYFSDFAMAAYFYGASTSNYESGIVIENNEMQYIRATAIYGYYLNKPVFRNNIVVMDTTGAGSSTKYILYYYYINGGEVSGNTFISNDLTYSMYLYDVQGDSDPFLVANNFIYSSYAGGNTAAVRSAASANNRIYFVHNNISFNSNASSYAVVDLSSGKNMRLVNNIISNQGSANLISASSSIAIDYSNHNNWYHPSSSLGNINGAGYADLAALQAGSSFDAASLSVDPAFNNEDLHTCVAALDAAGEALGLQYDIDGDIRNMTTPDIGADEFMGSAAGLLANGDTFEKCPSASVTFGAAPVSGVTYSWTPGGATTSELTASAAGQYIVTAQSQCGSFSDTVTVTDSPLPVAAFTVGTTFGLSASFTNSSSNATGYLWDFGDGNTSTDENPTHIYGAEGVYTITLTVYGACDTLTTTQTYAAVAFSTESLEDGSFRIYPNPADAYINLEIAGMPAGDVTVSIIDMEGRTVWSNAFNLNGNVLKTIDIQMLQPGVYVVKLESPDTALTRRIVKK